LEIKSTIFNDESYLDDDPTLAPVCRDLCAEDIVEQHVLTPSQIINNNKQKSSLDLSVIL
jgi:hypothetical protein